MWRHLQQRILVLVFRLYGYIRVVNEDGYWCSSLSYRPGLGNMGEFPNSGTGREPMHRRSSQAYHDTEILVAWDSRTQIYWSASV